MAERGGRAPKGRQPAYEDEDEDEYDEVRGGRIRTLGSGASSRRWRRCAPLRAARPGATCMERRQRASARRATCDTRLCAAAGPQIRSPVLGSLAGRPPPSIAPALPVSCILPAAPSPVD